MRTRPICFGILWFFIALAPTSSLVRLYQIANDHRMFFPNIGLALSATWAVFLLVIRYEAAVRQRVGLRYGLLAVATGVLAAHAYGIHQRSDVWGSTETLWYDVTLKSPANGRGLMNYGRTQMRKGEYERALAFFERAMQHMPKYSYLHINLGILKDAMGAPGDEVETYFTNALNYDRRNPSAYLYYGRWLSSQGRSHEALPLLERGRSLSPGHRELNETLRAVREESRRAASAEVAALRERVATDPSPESWVEVSLAYYHADMLVESVAACDSALALRPDYALAYNNKCSAYCRMGEWEKASAACEKALAITPNFEQARNNLKWARSGMAVPGQE